jgi:hypothetical protein
MTEWQVLSIVMSVLAIVITIANAIINGRK